MMECRKLRLYIGAGSHFLRGTDEHPHLTGAHLAKQLFLLRLGVCRIATVKRIMKSLQDKNYIRRERGKRYGRWEVLV